MTTKRLANIRSSSQSMRAKASRGLVAPARMSRAATEMAARGGWMFRASRTSRSAEAARQT